MFYTWNQLCHHLNYALFIFVLTNSQKKPNQHHLGLLLQKINNIVALMTKNLNRIQSYKKLSVNIIS